MKKDTYSSYRALIRAECEGEDFRIHQSFDPKKRTIIIAPHGGRIETRTSDIARAIAGGDFNLYLFEGLKKKGNRSLHITSHKFDEPRCRVLVSKSERVIAVHGCKGLSHKVYLGGRDEILKQRIASALRANGLSVRTKNHQFMGRNRNNICNRGATGAGVQLEITRALRMQGGVEGFVAAVRKALHDDNAV